MGNKKILWQRAGLIALTVLITIALIWIHTYRRSVQYYKDAEVLLSEGKLLDAVTSFEIAAHAYTPWNSHVKRSLEQLWALGQKLEKEKDDPSYALIAYRSLRSSIYAIRSFYMPYKDWIPKCDSKIQHLVNVQKKQLEEDRKKRPTPTI